MPKPTRGRRPAAAGSGREALVGAALAAFRTNSFDTVSVAAQARRAKVSQPLFSYIFPREKTCGAKP